MKRNLLFLLTFILLFPYLSKTNAQDCKAFLPAKEGSSLTYENYNAKDKPTGKMVQKLVLVSERNDTVIYTIDQKMYDKTDELVYEGQLNFKCFENNFYFDMNSYLDRQQFAMYENMEVKVTMDDIFFPETLEAGMSLDDGFINIEINAQMMKMNFNTRIYNRKVEAKEDLTTPAGTFETYKLSADIETKTPMMKIILHTVEWYSPNIGMIKSESYDKKGKLDSYSLLVGYSE